MIFRVINILFIISIIFCGDYDFVITKEVASKLNNSKLTYIEIKDSNFDGKWELLANVSGSGHKYLKDSNNNFYLESKDNNSAFSFTHSYQEDLPIKFRNSNIDTYNINSIKVIVELKENLSSISRDLYYSFTGECVVNNSEYIANIKFIDNALQISNLKNKTPFMVDRSCFETDPKNNSTIKIVFKNNSSVNTNIYLFADCNNLYDFSDYKDHYGRHTNIEPGQECEFKIKKASWKNIKYRITKNKKPLDDGVYISDINMKGLIKSGSFTKVIDDNFIKKHFGNKEKYYVLASDLKNQTNVQYILDNKLYELSSKDEYGIQNNKIKFQTGNINEIRHLTIGGHPAIIEDVFIKKANNPTLIIVDLNASGNAKNDNAFKQKLKDIYSKTYNSEYHIFQYLNQFPYYNPDDPMMWKNRFFSTSFENDMYDIDKIYLLDFKQNGDINKNKIHSQYPYIDNKNYKEFHQNLYSEVPDKFLTSIGKLAWTFGPVLSDRSLDFIPPVSSSEKLYLKKYLSSFSNMVLDQNVGFNSVLPSNGNTQFKKIYYIYYGDIIKQEKIEKELNKAYQDKIIFVRYTDYNKIFN